MIDSRSWWLHPASRVLSFSLASLVSIAVLIYPVFLFHNQMPSHAVLSLIMLGMAGGFTHGVGYQPRYLLWKVLFGPLFAWPILAYALFLVVQVLLG